MIEDKVKSKHYITNKPLVSSNYIPKKKQSKYKSVNENYHHVELLSALAS